MYLILMTHKLLETTTTLGYDTFSEETDRI